MIKVIDFYADWCRPCKQLAPILEEINAENSHISIEKIDIEDDKNEELVSQYVIYSIPTLIIFKDDIQVDKIVGGVSKNRIMEVLNKYK